MKKSILGAFILVLAFVGYSQAVPQGNPFQGLLALIDGLDARVTNLEASGGGGGGVFEAARGEALAGEIRYSISASGNILNEEDAQIPIPRDGELLSLAVNPFFNTLDGGAEITVRLNAVDTALQIVVPSDSTDVITTTAVVPVVAGNLLSLEYDTTGAEEGSIRFIATYEFR